MPLDIGVGILISIFASHIFGVDLTLQLAIMSVLANLIPDLDVFVELAKRGRVGGRVQGHHRELTHFPLTFIPLVFIVNYFFGGLWAFIIGLNLFAHFIHDSIGMGWGIKWLWPFSKRSYKLFSNKQGSLIGRDFIVSWNPKELKDVIAKHGDDHWFRNFYIKFHPVFVLELVIFALGVLLLYSSL